MKTSASKIALITLLLPLAAAPQAPSKVGQRTTTAPQTTAPPTAPRPNPSPSPTPPKVNPGVAPAPISNVQYSPAQLDYGSLWDGESAKRTLSLTAPAAGPITLSFPGGGLFWLAEVREMGPITGGSKNPPMSPMNKNSFQRQLKSRTTYQIGTPVSPSLQFNVSAGSELQIDVVFKPITHPQGTTGEFAPGLKSIWMLLNGPGVIQPWSIKVLARGIFNGSK